MSKGEGVRPDPKEAFRWYLKAAKKGHCDAAYNLAHLYDIGRGVKRNPSKAREWYARSERLRDHKERKGRGIIVSARNE